MHSIAQPTKAEATHTRGAGARTDGRPAPGRSACGCAVAGRALVARRRRVEAGGRSRRHSDSHVLVPMNASDTALAIAHRSSGAEPRVHVVCTDVIRRNVRQVWFLAEHVIDVPLTHPKQDFTCEKALMRSTRNSTAVVRTLVRNGGAPGWTRTSGPELGRSALARPGDGFRGEFHVYREILSAPRRPRGV